MFHLDLDKLELSLVGASSGEVMSAVLATRVHPKASRSRGLIASFILDALKSGVTLDQSLATNRSIGIADIFVIPS